MKLIEFLPLPLAVTGKMDRKRSPALIGCSLIVPSLLVRRSLEYEPGFSDIYHVLISVGILEGWIISCHILMAHPAWHQSVLSPPWPRALGVLASGSPSVLRVGLDH